MSATEIILEWQKIILNSPVLSNLLWVGLILLVILFFRKEISGLIPRTTEAKFGSLAAKFDKEINKTQSELPDGVLYLSTIYGLGQAIFLAQYNLYMDQSRAYKSLDDASYFAKASGFNDEAKQLDTFKRHIQLQAGKLSNEEINLIIDTLFNLNRAIRNQLLKKSL